MDESNFNEILSYVIGAALGDGNLSNPNKRATRLRITCDTKYPELILTLTTAIQILLPKNKVSIVYTSDTHINISCYSNKWEDWLGWKVGHGTKCQQNICIPSWIKSNRNYQLYCLKGLIETDGSVYYDRGYIMVNFVTASTQLASDVVGLLNILGYHPTISKLKTAHLDRFNIRICRNARNLITELRLQKTPNPYLKKANQGIL